MPQTIYIQCHDKAGQMLRYDTGTGRYTLVKRDVTFPEESFAHGFYIVHDQTLIAVVPSTKGPLLLLGDRRYALVGQNITFGLGDAEEGQINTFKILLDGQEIYATDYERPYSGYAAFTEPEVVDFFYWLNEGFGTPEVVQCYTLPQGQGVEAETHELPLPPRPEMPPAEPDNDSQVRLPLRQHAYPWPLQLLALLTFCVWISSFKPAWSYLPAAIDLTRGEYYLQRGQYSHAITALNQALVEVPSAKKAKISLAVAYFSNSDDSDDLLGLKALDDMELGGEDWDRIKAVLPAAYREQFVEVKKK